MPSASLTAVSVQKLRPPASGQIEYYDRRLPSFGLRISYHGTRSWFVMTRLHGKLIRVTLGKLPMLSLAEAREKARGVARLAAAGTDPRRLRAEAEQKLREERRNTFAACAADFLQIHAEQRLRPSTRKEYRRVLTGPDTRSWQHLPLTDIKKRDVLDVLHAIDRRGSPGAAKRFLVYLRKFFNWCAERDLIVTVPTDRIPAPHPEVKRDRVLSEAELACLIRALSNESSVFGPIVRLLLLTGQRRAEVCGMRWSELRELSTDDAIWEIPGERTKNKRKQLVPLVPTAREIILNMPRSSDFVFTTTGETPVSGLGKAKARLEQAIKANAGGGTLPQWTLHDLRRTAVTVMNEKLGIAPHVVEAVVNHISGQAKAGVAGVYNRALYLDDRRRALESWAAYLCKLGLRDSP
jgi:integrase